MKKSLIVLTVLLSLFAGVATAATNSGSAVIPHYQTQMEPEGFGYRTYITVSNITDKNINVEIVLYKINGTILTDTDNSPARGTIRMEDISLAHITNYREDLSGVTLAFTLAPNSSGTLMQYMV